MLPWPISRRSVAVPHGTGSLVERPPGSGRWYLRVYAGRNPVTGRARQATRAVVAPNKAAVGRMLTAFIVEQAECPQLRMSATLGAVLDEWLRHSEARGRSPRTIHEAGRTVDTVLAPELGSVPIRDLTPRHLDELYRRLLTGQGRRRKLAPASVRRYHSVLSAALGQAVKWGWIERNRAAQASPPELGHRVLTIPTADEVKALLAAAQARSPRWGMLLALAVGTGARRGKLCALRWPDVDARVIKIRRSVYRAGAERGEKVTKGGRERWVAVGPAVAALLNDWRARCEEAATRANVALVADAFMVSPLPNGPTPVNPDTLSTVVNKLCANPSDDNPAGLGIPHVHLRSLRHYAATELIGTGVNPRDTA